MTLTSTATAPDFRDGSYKIYRVACDNAPCTRVDQMPARSEEDLVEKMSHWYFVDGPEASFCPVCAVSKLKETISLLKNSVKEELLDDIKKTIIDEMGG